MDVLQSFNSGGRNPLYQVMYLMEFYHDDVYAMFRTATKNLLETMTGCSVVLQEAWVVFTEGTEREQELLEFIMLKQINWGTYLYNKRTKQLIENKCSHEWKVMVYDRKFGPMEHMRYPNVPWYTWFTSTVSFAVHVYVLHHMTEPMYAKYKEVLKPIQDCISGCDVQFDNGFLVYAEGSTRQLKTHARHMIDRIDWTEMCATYCVTTTENYCSLVLDTFAYRKCFTGFERRPSQSDTWENWLRLLIDYIEV